MKISKALNSLVTKEKEGASGKIKTQTLIVLV